MARPLSKTKLDGALYRRPDLVEAQVDDAVQLKLADLRLRLLARKDEPGYLTSECLVHLLRHGCRRGDQELISAVLPVLLRRCEAILLTVVPDDGMPDAASLREDILGEFSELFALDGSGEHPNELDFYECRFNRAFRTLRIDAVRRDAARRRKHVDVVARPASEAEDEPDAYEDAFARVSDAFKVPPTQERDASLEAFVTAIEALPADEREAVILVHGFGYKEESEDPEEETAATRCNCTGRTIRNRLTRAAAKLTRFREDL